MKLVIRRIVEETDGVKTFYLDGADTMSLPYNAGQYLTFIHRHHGREIRRSYSILSSPYLQEPLAITVKRIDNGIVSRWLIDHAKTGDVLTTTGAAGFFTLPDNVAELKQLYFFAAGSGIVPVYSLIKTALHQYPHLSIILAYSNHAKSATLFYLQLTQMAAQFPERFYIHWLFSDHKDLAKARLNKEITYNILNEHATGSKRDAFYYLCGPFAYMRNTFIALEEAHIPVDHIKRENFNTERQVAHQQPPDKEAHTVIIKQGGKEHRLEVQYPVNILKAARKQGIIIPYSCEVGRCGSCAGKCTDGKVWMSNNEVLTENEIDKGLVLTCTGYPVGGNVTIEL